MKFSSCQIPEIVFHWSSNHSPFAINIRNNSLQFVLLNSQAIVQPSYNQVRLSRSFGKMFPGSLEQLTVASTVTCTKENWKCTEDAEHEDNFA